MAASLFYHMFEGEIVGFLPEALKSSSVEHICYTLWVGGWYRRTRNCGGIEGPLGQLTYVVVNATQIKLTKYYR